jgi:hypothetical protein
MMMMVMMKGSAYADIEAVANNDQHEHAQQRDATEHPVIKRDFVILEVVSVVFYIQWIPIVQRDYPHD